MARKIKLYYILIMLISLSLYELSAPYTYPILLLLTGNGRFNDWYLTLGGVSNYPQVIDGICTIPWIYAYFLIKMNSYFGIFYSHIIYVFASLSILFFSYRRLNISFDKTTSFLLIFTYPILFGFWRGNSDFLIYGLILASYFYGANYTYTSSLLYLGSAIAFKPYQVFLLFAFKLKILWDNILIIFLGIMTIIIFIYIANNDFFTSSYKEIIKCGAWYTKEYAIADGGTLHNNSLWGLSKLVVYYFYNNGGQVKVIEFMSIYLEMWPFLLIGVFLILNSFVRLFNSDHNRFSTKFFLICLLIPLLSPIVPDYRLFFLNVCLIICLTNKMAENINLKVLVSILVFILIPKEFRWFALNGAWFTPNGALNCIAMLILLGYIIVKNLKVKKLPQRNPI